MKHLRFYFDPISPYAALAFEHLPQALEGLSYSVEYRPILFAALLHALGAEGAGRNRAQTTVDLPSDQLGGAQAGPASAGPGPASFQSAAAVAPGLGVCAGR